MRVVLILSVLLLLFMLLAWLTGCVLVCSVSSFLQTSPMAKKGQTAWTTRSPRCFPVALVQWEQGETIPSDSRARRRHQRSVRDVCVTSRDFGAWRRWRVHC
jgi:hypothetical protein